MSRYASTRMIAILPLQQTLLMARNDFSLNEDHFDRSFFISKSNVPSRYTIRQGFIITISSFSFLHVHCLLFSLYDISHNPVSQRGEDAVELNVSSHPHITIGAQIRRKVDGSFCISCFFLEEGEKRAPAPYKLASLSNCVTSQ